MSRSRAIFEALPAFIVLGSSPAFDSVADALKEWVATLAIGAPGEDALTLIGDHAPAIIEGYIAEPFVLADARYYDAEEIVSILSLAHSEIFEEGWNDPDAE